MCHSHVSTASLSDFRERTCLIYSHFELIELMGISIKPTNSFLFLSFLDFFMKYNKWLPCYMICLLNKFTTKTINGHLETMTSYQIYFKGLKQFLIRTTQTELSSVRTWRSGLPDSAMLSSSQSHQFSPLDKNKSCYQHNTLFCYYVFLLTN